MQDAQQFLGYSAMVVAAISLIAVSKVGFSAYAATFSDRKFGYRVDKLRLPICLYLIIALAILSFTYGFLIARQTDLALTFCFLATFPGGLAILLSIAYVPKESKSKGG